MFVYNLNPFDIKFKHPAGKEYVIRGSKHFNKDKFVTLYHGLVATEVPNAVWDEILNYKPYTRPVFNNFKKEFEIKDDHCYKDTNLFKSGSVFYMEREKDGNKRYYEELEQRKDLIKPCDRTNPNPNSNLIFGA